MPQQVETETLNIASSRMEAVVSVESLHSLQPSCAYGYLHLCLDGILLINKHS